MRVGELIEMARQVKGWTLRDLEKETGISNALISQIETGHVKDPSFTKVVRLCEALNLPLEKAAQCVSLKALKAILKR
jgi:HTH-type transcriptional regulator, competence development regulator